MNPKNFQFDPKAVGTSLSVLLLSCGASAAHAGHNGQEIRHLGAFNSGEWRQARREQRQQVQAESSAFNRSMQQYLGRTVLPTQISEIRNLRTDLPRRSTYINDAGSARSLRSGLSLDLSSTDASILVGSKLLGDSTVLIDVGGSTKEIKAGSQVTASEYAALNQVLSSGKQDLKLNDRGAAINGSLNLNVVSDNGKAINTSAFVIPEGVAVTGDFGRHADGIRVQNDLANYGSLYATSSNRRGTAIIGARDVDNYAGGLITTDISKSVASSLNVSSSSLDLAVRADRDLNNHGEISSSGSLELSAGRTLNNSGQALANGTVSLNSATINNTGLVSSAKGDLNITAATDQNLTVNAYGGEFSALNCNINVATTVGANPKTGTTMLGGAWQAKQLNIDSGDGRIVGDIEDTTALVNMTGGSAAFNSNGANLLLGTVDCSGDPLISSANNLTIGADQVTGGNPLAIIAGADINVANGVTTLDTSSAAGGGTITIVAGANFSVNPGTSLTINGGTIGGGNINLNGLFTINSSGKSGNANGGNITIIGFDAFLVGRVVIPTTLQADASGTGKGGNITVIGGYSPGTAITMQGATSSGSGKGGDILIAAAQGFTSPSVVIDATAASTQGAILSGAFGAGLNVGGDVTIQNSIITNGGSVTVRTSSILDMQAVSTSPVLANTSAGVIDISGFSVNINSSLSAIGSGTGNGGKINVDGLVGVAIYGVTNSSGGASGKGGDITLNSTNGSLLINSVIANGGTTSGNAGNISVQGSSATGTNSIIGTQVYAKSVVGAGGNILISGAGVSILNDVTIASTGSTSSGNVTLIGNGSGSGGGPGVNGISGNTLEIDTKGATVSGDIIVTTDSTHGMKFPAGNLIFNAGRDITLNLGSAGIATSGTSGMYADSGTVDFQAGRDIVGGTVKIITQPLTVGSAGGNVSLTSGISGTLTIGMINTSSFSTSILPGVISLNGGTGGLVLNGSLTATSQGVNAGSIFIAGNSDLTIPAVTTGSVSITSTGSITTTDDIVVNSAQMVSSTSFITLGNDGSDDVIAANGLNMNAATSITQVGTITTKSLDVSFAGAGTTNLTVDSPTPSNVSLLGTITNGKLVLNITNVGNLDIGVNMKDLKVVASGGINLNSATNASSLDLQSGSGTGIEMFGNVVANTNGIIRLKATDGNILESGGSLQTSGTGFVALTLDGTSADANLGGANNINVLSTTGSAVNSTVTVNNDSNPITINGLNGTQNLIVSTTNAATGVVIGAAINTTGTLQFDTPRLFNDKSVSAASILIENLNGNLSLVGGAAPGGILTATTPAAGSPGNPSNPTAINIVTMNGANLNLSGKMVFNGDVTLDNSFGTTTSNAGSQFDGNNNVILRTSTWNTSGSQITGKNFIFEQSGNGNIVNSQGAINFNSNITIKGHDVTFVALTDINITGTMTVNLSNDMGSAGSLTMLAGYEVTPATAGQQQNASSYTLTATPSAGSINASNLTVNTSATGSGNNAGDVVVIANGGSVQIGNINASSASAAGGHVTVIGQNGVTVGDVITSGAVPGDSVLVASAVPEIFGTPQLDNGTISGGSFGISASPALTAFNVSLNAITSSSITATSGGLGGNLLQLLGALNGNLIDLDAGVGELRLTFSDNLVANSNAGFGGILLLAAGVVTGSGLAPVTLTANGSLLGGEVGLTLRGPAGVTLGTDGGEFTLTAAGAGSGGIAHVLAVGDITVEANGINTKGANGDGASNTLISQGAVVLNDNAILNVDGTGANSDGGVLRIEAGDTIVFSSTSTSPLLISANGTGTGSGGSIIYKSADTAPVYIGMPVKSVKGTADFLSLTARGGATGGDGGEIDVEVGGSLFVDPTKALAGPQAGTSDGGDYKFKAGTTLIVNGGLSADGINGGDGGSIDLESNSKTSFVVNNGGRLPKNGTSGPITANGTDGSITVRNFGGALKVASALTADILTLQAGLKGSIGTSKGVVLTADDIMILQTDTGKMNKLTVSSPYLQAISNGAVTINDTFAGPVFVDDSSAGKGGFNLTSAGSLELSDITVVNGNILVKGGTGGTLTVDPTAQITAENGSITLNNPDAVNGSLNVLKAANIATSGTKGGNVIVCIGAIPKKGFNTTPVPNFGTDPQGKGKIYFDGIPNGIQVIVGPLFSPLATAINKNVIFSNLSTGSGLITVSPEATFTADPPLVRHTNSVAVKSLRELVGSRQTVALRTEMLKTNDLVFLIPNRN